MLPFLKERHQGAAASVETIERKPDEPEESDDYDSLVSAMEELHAALHIRDYQGAAEIFRSAFELLDSEPHQEGPHIG
jgi:hypothetical protein